MLPPDVSADVAAIGRLDVVSTILNVLPRVTGLRCALVARVTQETWTACAVADDAGLGLEPGVQLSLASTYCRDVCEAGRPLLVVSSDPA